MNFKMKRKYIIPKMMVESFSASSSILVGSPDPTEGGEYNAGESDGTGSGSGSSISGGISGSGGGGLKQHSKQYDAWTTWDE